MSPYLMKILKKSKGKWIAVGLAVAIVASHSPTVQASETSPGNDTSNLTEVLPSPEIIAPPIETPEPSEEVGNASDIHTQDTNNSKPEPTTTEIATANLATDINSNPEEITGPSINSNPKEITEPSIEITSSDAETSESSTQVDTEAQLAIEQAKAIDKINTAWVANSTEAIRLELDRQANLNLSAYIIQWGDTLNRIAQASNLSVDYIVETNKIFDPNLIYTGERLFGLFNPSNLNDANVEPTTTEETNLLAMEKQRALQGIQSEWTINTALDIEAEITRQNNLRLSDYVIQWGDTLNRIATVVNKPVSEIAQVNKITNPNLIYTGNTLKGILNPKANYPVDPDLPIQTEVPVNPIKLTQSEVPTHSEMNQSEELESPNITQPPFIEIREVLASSTTVPYKELVTKDDQEYEDIRIVTQVGQDGKIQIYNEEILVNGVRDDAQTRFNTRKEILAPIDELITQGSKLIHSSEQVTSESVIPFDKVERFDETLLKDERVIKTLGQDGILVTTHRQHYVKEQLSHTELISQEVKLAPVTEEILVGSRIPLNEQYQPLTQPINIRRKDPLTNDMVQAHIQLDAPSHLFSLLIGTLPATNEAGEAAVDVTVQYSDDTQDKVALPVIIAPRLDKDIYTITGQALAVDELSPLSAQQIENRLVKDQAPEGTRYQVQDIPSANDLTQDTSINVLVTYPDGSQATVAVPITVTQRAFEVTSFDLITPYKETPYIDKNTEFKALVRIETTYDSDLSHVVINDQEYAVTKTTDGYQINLNSGNIVGVNHFTLKQARLANTRQAVTNQSLEITILKDLPQFKHLSTTESADGYALNLQVTDSDASLSNKTKLQVMDESGNTLLEQELSIGENTVNLPLSIAYQYQWKVIADTSRAEALAYQSTNHTYLEGVIENLIPLLEYKTIQDAQFYQLDGDKVVESTSLDTTKPDDYLVQITFADGRQRLLPVIKLTLSGNQVQADLGQTNGTLYYDHDGQRKAHLSLTIDTSKGLTLIPSQDTTNMTWLTHHANYDETKRTIYENLHRLSPFYDSYITIKDSDKVATDSRLATDRVLSVLAMDAQGQVVNYLSQGKEGTITQIKVIYADHSSDIFEVTYEKTLADVAGYRLKDSQLRYQFDKFITLNEASAIATILERVDPMIYSEFANGMDANERTARVLNDHYTRLKVHLPELIRAYIGSSQAINPTFDNEILNAKLVEHFSQDNLANILYTLNYMDRFYNVDFDGLSLRDVILFNQDIFGKTQIDSSLVMAELKAAPLNQRGGNLTATTYQQRLSKYIDNQSIDKVIERLVQIQHADLDEDYNAWFKQAFKGVLSQPSHEPLTDRIAHDVWSQVKRVFNLNFILPALTIPSDRMYIVAMPSQIGFGSMDHYILGKNSAEDRAIFEGKLTDFANKTWTFYNNMSKINPEILNRMPRVLNANIDTRNTHGAFQEYDSTQNLIMRDLYSLFNIQPANNGSGAYANGNNTWYVWYAMLNSYSTWTHETTHNQDGSIFFNGLGRRRGRGAEDFASGLYEQSFGMNAILANYAETFESTRLVSTNYNPDRINSPERFKDFYEKSFEVINYLDYVQAKAFLQLTPEQQAALAVQANYPDEAANPSAVNARIRTHYKKLTVDELKAMNLKTLEDLWDNRLLLKPGITELTQGNNTYSSTTMADSLWYQPHSNTGISDGAIFKYIAYQMAAEGGFNGFLNWVSGNRTDQEALRLATGNDTLTWKTYKLGKYTEIEANADKNLAFDTQALINLFKIAMTSDSQDAGRSKSLADTLALKETIYHNYKRVTDDFRTSMTDVQPYVEIESVQDFMDKIKANPRGYFRLQTDLDYSSIATDVKDGYITDAFYGLLDGNNRTISGLNQALFKQLNNARIMNLKFANSTLNLSGDSHGILARTSTGRSWIENVHIGENVTITAEGHLIGGLVGYAERTTFNQISVNATINGRNNVGGIAGEAYLSTLSDLYTAGEVTGWTNVGGIVGHFRIGNALMNTFSQSQVNGSNVNSTGGVMGHARYIVARNNLSLAEGSTGYRFVGSDSSDQGYLRYNNNYIFNYAKLIDDTIRDTVDSSQIKLVTQDDLTKRDFYTESLKWDTTIWDLSGIEEGLAPKLKSSLDSNQLTLLKNPIIIKEIASLDDLLSINSGSAHVYRLTADIDASGYRESAPLITTLSGRFEGGGHTISNLSSILIGNLTGTVTDLTLKDARIERASVNNIATLASMATGAVVTNVSVINPVLSGRQHVGGLIGYTNGFSVFENIEVINAMITSNYFYGGGLIGRTNSGNFNNIFVTGKLITKSTHEGGVMGATQNNTKLNKVVSLMDIVHQMGDARKRVGGLIGAVEPNNTTTVKDALVLAKIDNQIYQFIADSTNPNGLSNTYVFAKDGIYLPANQTSSSVGQLSDDEVKLLATYRDKIALNTDFWTDERLEKIIAKAVEIIS